MRRIRYGRVFGFAIPATLILIASTAIGDPVWARAVGIDVWNMGHLEGSLRQYQKASQRLDNEILSAQNQHRINQLLVADLMEDKIELASAATQYFEMNRNGVGFLSALEFYCDGPTLQARSAHCLARQINDRLRDDPVQRAILHARLKQQFFSAFDVELSLAP